MTIFCVSSVGFDVPPCSSDMRPADRGFLCNWCYERVVHAYEKWDRFAAQLDATDGRAVQNDNLGIRASAQLGYLGLPLTSISKIECENHLRSIPAGGIDMWVATEHGAYDAIRFAHAAERAYRDIRVEDTPTKMQVRCHSCGQKTLIRNPPPYENASISVTCRNESCGAVIREGDSALVWKQDETGQWLAHREDALTVLADIEITMRDSTRRRKAGRPG